MYAVNSRGLGSAGRGRGLEGNWPWLPLPVPFLGCREASQENVNKLPLRPVWPSRSESELTLESRGRAQRGSSRLYVQKNKSEL